MMTDGSATTVAERDETIRQLRHRVAALKSELAESKVRLESAGMSTHAIDLLLGWPDV
jgi:hypothetical protein